MAGQEPAIQLDSEVFPRGMAGLNPATHARYRVAGSPPGHGEKKFVGESSRWQPGGPHSLAMTEIYLSFDNDRPPQRPNGKGQDSVSLRT